MATDLTVNLLYSQDEGPGKSPYYYTFAPDPEETGRKDTYRGKRVEVEVTVRDGRNHDLKLDQHSFELVTQETELSTDDFYKDQEKIKSVYYSEMEKLIKEKTGAAHVMMFHHQVRARDHNASPETGTVSTVQPYAAAIHSDSHPKSARDLFRTFAGGLDAKYHKGRFLYINAWRNISDTPIGNDHLAVLDETSIVKPDDYIVSEFYDKMVSLQQYSLLDVNSSQHKWHYFSAMKKNEVLLFKQFDSDTTLKGRLCFHTSFNDPNAPECPDRQSIEARGIAFFPDHQPNTCPNLEEVQEALNIPSLGDKNRVKSKHLFDFKLEGVYDEEVYTDIKKNKAKAEIGRKMLLNAAKKEDDGMAFAKVMRSFLPYITQQFNIPFFQEKVDGCSHETFKVPKDYGNECEVPVIVHRPKNLNGKSAAIIFARGVAVAGKAEDFKMLSSNLAINCGVTVFDVDYRIAPEAKCPQHIMDMYAATKHVSKHADKFNIDTNKIAIMGDGWGGYICSGLEVMLAQKGESALVKLAILSAAMLDDYCFGDVSLMTYEEKTSAEIIKAIWRAIAANLTDQAEDPLLYPGKADSELLAKFPPTVILEREFGAQITSNMRLATRLRSAGRLLELVVQPGNTENQAVLPKFKKFHESLEIVRTVVSGYLVE